MIKYGGDTALIANQGEGNDLLLNIAWFDEWLS